MNNEKPLYVLVHTATVDDYTTFTDSELINKTIEEISYELKRIRASENFIESPDDYRYIVDHISENSRNRNLFVCGAFSDPENPVWCVDEACEILKNNGYNARVYPPATLHAKYDSGGKVR